jgi:hypothetical protein
MTRLGTSDLGESNKGLKYSNKVTVEMIGSTSQDLVKVVFEPLSTLNPKILVVHGADDKSSVNLNTISSTIGILPSDASSLWMEEGCWIYFIQDANGRQWDRSYRDFQIYHVQPD